MKLEGWCSGQGKGNLRFQGLSVIICGGGRCSLGHKLLFLCQPAALSQHRAGGAGGAGRCGAGGDAHAALTWGASEIKYAVNSAERDVKLRRPVSSSPEPAPMRKAESVPATMRFMEGAFPNAV